MANKNPLLAKVHIAKKELCLSDDEYRAILVRLFDKDSAGKLRYGQLNDLINHFKTLGWKPKTKGTKTHRPTAQKPMVRMVYVLWGELFKAGKVKEARPDKFVQSFTRRSKKYSPEVSAAEWLDNQQLYAIIEALKSWCIREGIELELPS